MLELLNTLTAAADTNDDHTWKIVIGTLIVVVLLAIILGGLGRWRS